MQQVVATSWLTSASLLGVLGLASNPDYRLLARPAPVTSGIRLQDIRPLA